MASPRHSVRRAVMALTLILALDACGDASASTAPDVQGPGSGSLQAAAISVAPGNVSLAVGDTARLSAVVKDAAGATLNGVSTTWRVLNASVATVGADGIVVGRAQGTTTVTATALGKTTSAPVVVVAPGTPTPAPTPTPTPTPTPEPTPTPSPTPSVPTYVPGTHTPLWMDDFESTLTDAAIFARYITQNGENGLHVDAGAGVGGSRALRMDWRAKSGCTDDSHFIEGAFPVAAQEVVVQYDIRYQPNFVFDWFGRSGCSGNAKKLFFLWAGAGSRFDFISENHVLGVGSDHDHPLFSQNVGGAALRPDDLADGQWHRITLRVRQSSTPTATDGYIHGWVDGVQKWKVDNIASNASGGWTLFKFPATFNQGSPVDQSEWVDNIRIWRP